MNRMGPLRRGLSAAIHIQPSTCLQQLHRHVKTKSSSSHTTHHRPFSTTSAAFAPASAPKPVSLKQLSESFMDGTSFAYVESMYESWLEDPNSVHSSWRSYFSNVLDKNLPPGEAYMSPPTQFSGSPDLAAALQSAATATSTSASTSTTTLAMPNLNMVTDNMRVLMLIRAYQVRGHVLADLDPLNLTHHEVPQELKLETYGFTEADLDREFFLGDTRLISGFLNQKPFCTLRVLLTRLKEVYCGTIGVEYMHIQDREQCNWVRERFETGVQYSFTKQEKALLLERLTWADGFERFVGRKWGQSKRFGLEGCEVLIPGMKSLIDRAAGLGVDSVVIGMPHRGRLNVLGNVLRKPLPLIFREFPGGPQPHTLDDLNPFSGDVKYHLGTACVRPTRSGKSVHLTLCANPSHLEAVDPIVEGRARAKQFFANDDKTHNKVMTIQLHGDAAFAGQGIVYEVVDMSGLPNYTTGGTIHIVVNNQIGFTTDPKQSRSSQYCSDVAKAARVPIFHVNGDDPEAVVHACNLAAEWRMKFKKDVVIDIVCYRRHGHNELDNPKYTQPLMYAAIERHPPVLQVYSQRLVAEKSVTEDEVKQMENKALTEFNKGFNERESYKETKKDWMSGAWQGFKFVGETSVSQPSCSSMENLTAVGAALVNTPPGFNLHRALVKILAEKAKMFQTGTGFDWAAGEALAFGTLLLEGHHVRLSGQDVERGTFSHRHSIVHDQQTGERYTFLNNLGPKAAPFTSTNSSLSEFAVLGFELGYSLENPNSLVLWEAQFGDFANGAQPIVDQFLSSQESKWMQQSGLVMLLPHAYEGQGPEHSSARLERYLQMVDDDCDVYPSDPADENKQCLDTNFQVVNCSTPANYYHALRRQIKRDFRKPLMVMTPKNLLKHALVTSSISEFATGTAFKTIIPETGMPDEFGKLVAPEKVRKVIFCSGKVYYDMWQYRNENKINDVALIRVEQIAPFPYGKVAEQLRLYSNAKIIWCQEEPKNMGAWTYVQPRFLTTLQQGLKKTSRQGAQFVGRPPSAATATGVEAIHKLQQIALIKQAFE